MYELQTVVKAMEESPYRFAEVLPSQVGALKTG
jgi:hypothetical protein